MLLTKYPAPGRGAWTLTGGLLPAKPGSASKAGYYRLAVAGESEIGSVQADVTHHQKCVIMGVQAIQMLVHATPDGWFGPATSTAVITAQKKLGIEADGIVGRATMRAALTPLITQIAAVHNVPPFILGGLITLESSLDPAAVGVNGQDHGLAQINLAAHGADVSLEDAMDEQYSLLWAASELEHTHDVWAARTAADPWNIAIANHNSPALARQWAQTGTAPVIEGRSIQIGDYVAKVRTAW